MNTNDVLNWVKDFKYSWLPIHLQNNTQVIDLISDKLYELEQLLNTNHEYHSDSPLVLTSLDNHQTINNENELFSYPAIRIKRLSLAEAKRFLPPGWDTPKIQVRRKRGRKRPSHTFGNRKRKRNLPSQTYDEITLPLNESPQCSTRNKPLLSTQSTEIPPINKNKSKQKRKLRAIDGEDDDLYTLGNLSQAETSIEDCEQVSRYIGQNGILSQTRKTNETTMTTFDDIHNSTMKSFSNIFPTTTTNEDLPMDDEPSIINNNNSILNYDVCVEDITNDGIDTPSSNQFPLTT